MDGIWDPPQSNLSDFLSAQFRKTYANFKAYYDTYDKVQEMSDSAAIWALSALDVTGRVSALIVDGGGTVQTLEERKELLVKFLELPDGGKALEP